MKKLACCAFVLFATIVGCNPAEGVCQKEFDCQTELKLHLEDDYVAVCAAEKEGVNNALRKNAERECKDLADAQVTLATCESTLSCADIAKDRSGGDTLCKSSFDDLVKKTVAAGTKCDAIVDGGGEGEGEGGQ